MRFCVLDIPRRWSAGVMAAVMVAAVATVVCGAQPATAASGATITGGLQIAPYGASAEPSIAFDGDRTLVVWSQVVDGTAGIYGKFMAPDATTAGARFTISRNAGHDSTGPAVAWSGSRFLVVWQSDFAPNDIDIQSRTLDAAGTLSPGLVPLATGDGQEFDPAVAAGSGGEFLVVWTSESPSTSNDVYSVRVGPNGGVLEPPGRASFDSAADARSEGQADVVWNGSTSQYLVMWSALNATTSALAASLRDQNGADVGHGYTQVHGRTLGVSDPAIATGGGNYLVAFAMRTGGGSSYDIAAIRITGAGIVGGPFPISSASGDQQTPAIAFNGQYLVAWKDRRNEPTGGDVYGARVKLDGTVLDPTGFPVYAASARDERPAVTPGEASGTFGIALQAQPVGKGTGIRAYGIETAAK
jgi:hypothetical protein